MIIPMRCWSCGKPISHLWTTYSEAAEKDRKTVLDELGLERYCCRSVMMGHVDLIELSASFRKA